MRTSKVLLALGFGMGLLLQASVASAGDIDGKAWGVVEKLNNRLMKGEGTFDKWVGTLDREMLRGTACANRAKLEARALKAIDKQYESLHSAVHKAREQLDKLADKGVPPTVIADAHNAINTMWWLYWDAEHAFWTTWNGMFAGCP